MNHENNTPKTSLFGGTSRRGVLISCVVVGILILAILFNCLLGLIPDHYLKWSVTGGSTFKVSYKTTEWLEKELKEDVTLYLLGTSGKENEVYLFLSDYAQKSKHISLEVVDPERDPEFINAYGGVWPEDNLSVLVESGKRYKIINGSDLYYYYNATSATRYSQMEYEYFQYMFEQYVQAYPDQGYDAAYEAFLADTQPHFDGETQVTSAIQYVLLEEVSTLYAVTGSTDGLATALCDELWKYGYEIKNLASVQSIPADCDLLVLQATKDLNEVEKIVLDSYLAKGGKLFLTSFYAVGPMTNLGAVLEPYGMGFLDKTHLLMEGDQNYISVSQNSSSYLMRAHILQHDATGTFTGSFLLDLMNEGVHVIDIKEKEGVTVKPWLQTSEKGFPAFRVGDSSEKGDEGVYTFGAIAEKGDTRIIWVATPSALSASMDSQSNGGNFGLAISAFNWMTDTESQLFEADAPVIKTSYLTVSDAAFVTWGTVLVILLPVAVLILGIAIWYARKRR